MAQTSKRPRRGRGLTGLLDPDFYRALSDPNRIAILGWLAQQRAARFVSEVAKAGCASVDLSVVSRHLAVLRDAGIIESVRDGKHVLYKVRARALVKSLRDLADAIETCCGVAPNDVEEEITKR